MLVHPGDDAEAEIAKLADFAAGDELCCVFFKNPGDPTVH